MFDPADLRLLQSVARTGSYSAAARELGYTQPAISYRMRSLEREVGSPLTVRRGRRMHLTEAGETLLRHADRILAAIRAADSDLAALRREPTGTVRLGAFPSSCVELVPAAMTALRGRHADVSVTLAQAEPPAARDLLRRGEIDVALCYHFGPCRHDNDRSDPTALLRISAGVDSMMLMLPADHPAAGRHEVAMTELAGSTWLVAGEQFRERLRELAAGVPIEFMQVADDYVTMQALVAHGFGLALVPELALRAHLDPRIVPRTLRGLPQRRIDIELFEDTLRVDAVRVVVEELVGVAKSLLSRRGLPSDCTLPSP